MIKSQLVIVNLPINRIGKTDTINGSVGVVLDYYKAKGNGEIWYRVKLKKNNRLVQLSIKHLIEATKEDYPELYI